LEYKVLAAEQQVMTALLLAEPYIESLAGLSSLSLYALGQALPQLVAWLAPQV
jgi:hypothetical protein